MMRRHVSILCHAAAHDSTQWHAIAALSIGIVAHQFISPKLRALQVSRLEKKKTWPKIFGPK